MANYTRDTGGLTTDRMRASLDLDRFGISSAPRKVAMALERIVSKKLTSRYESGACNRWLKVKNPTYERR